MILEETNIVNSTNQNNIPERGTQVSQMKRIYESAKSTIIWVGEDAEQPKAQDAKTAINKISDIICDKLGVSVSELNKIKDICNDLVFKNRDKLPLPETFNLSTDLSLDSLVWLFSKPYFTRVWVVQEIYANDSRMVHCGEEVINWERLQMVASYFTTNTAWSKQYGFTSTHCWYVAKLSAVGFSYPENWPQMLYLASNFASTDPRDQIFGLRGLMKQGQGADLLMPDYSKSTLEIYRDSVESALMDFQSTDVLNYTSGTKMAISWVPEWNRAMLFRNPFRLGKSLPWKPAGVTKAVWNVNREANILYLTGKIIDKIKYVESYKENYFDNIVSEDDRMFLRQNWTRILNTIEQSQSQVPFTKELLTTVATSFSFGLNEKAEPGDEHVFFVNFIAYLKAVLTKEAFNKYISADLAKDAENGEAHTFGKPVWDFNYPESTFFITETGVVGCSTDINNAGDVVFIPLGSVYPLILRPSANHYFLKGFAYVYGHMYGNSPSETQIVEIH
jgi:Heterokaryon incompatibility protein (HET)